MKVLKHLLISGFIATFGIASAQAQFTQVKIVKPDAGQISGSSDGTARNNRSDIYIVQMKNSPVVAYEGDMAGYAATKPSAGKKINENPAAVKKYAGFLMTRQNEVIQSVGAEKVYNYVYAFNGFAARMSAAAAQSLRKRPDVVNVWKDEIRQLETDGSVEWIGVTGTGGAWFGGYTGEDVVVASIDTGAWPENPSFRDTRTPILGDYGPWLYLGPVPDDFQASGCDFGNSAKNPYDADFSCNRKLVAARCYNAGFSTATDPTNPCGSNGSRLAPWEFHSARDADGHGSHTGATAAGNYNTKARINGEIVGRTTGVAPRARLAFYKVCWDGTSGSGCASSDSAAAIDQAVLDGADVINFSVGGSSTIFSGPDDIAFLFAADAGVHVATSNGNSGPEPQTTGTPAGVPWLTAVGNSQDDGAYFTKLTIHTPPSVAGDIFANEGSGSTRLIDTGPISGDIIPASTVTACNADGPNDPIAGIALVSRGACSFTEKFLNAAAAGASAIIVYNNTAGGLSMSVGTVPIPGISITQAEGQALAAETGVTGTMSAQNAANQIAGSSSRGPNGGAMDMIKPDVVAPGTAILAAYSPWNGGEDFASISGTSMASPHVAGAFALLKQAHPDWTPAQSKSALMTTARQDLLKTYGLGPADPFDMGAGEILPTDALNPGLTYDAGVLDYIAFLCGVPEQAFIFGYYCPTLDYLGFSLDPSDLNTASIAVADLLSSQTVPRTVTNMAYGEDGTWKERRQAVTTYYAHVDAPPGVEVLLSDWELELKGGESATYDITFNVKRKAVVGEWAFGSITWKSKDGKYVVRSPIAVRPSAIKVADDSIVTDNGNGTGTFSVPVQFGYSGEYNTSVSGLEPGFGVPSFVNSGGASTDYWCWNVVDDGQTHLRLRTWDQDVTTSPGVDDLDMSAYVLNGDCATATAWTRQLGSSGGATSNEIIDIFAEDLTPGLAIYVEVDYFSSVSGTIEYEMWFQGVWGDTGTTSVDAPSQATAGTSDVVEVDYDIPFPGRWLGILHHEDADSEIGRTILELDAETNAP